MKKKQIRFMRPNPQSFVNDIFLRGAKAERTMMIIIDSNYSGQPDSIKPGNKVPPLLKLGKEAIDKEMDIFKKTLKQLKATNWKFRMTSDIGKRPYLEIMKEFSSKKVDFTKFKSKSNSTRSLIIFARIDSSGDQWLDIMNEYLELDKPVCVVDEFGVKRYPRKEV